MTSGKIITEHVYPPIPMRQFDWAAYREDYEPPDSDGVGGGHVGWGRTEAEAIADLRDAEDEAPDAGPLTNAEKQAQAARCPCHGTDDLCPCQNTRQS